MYKRQVYTKVPLQECYDVTGKAPIGTSFVDVNKGDNVHPNYRSRLVATEVNRQAMLDMFAAMPPLEAIKALFSLCATASTNRDRRGPKKLAFIDIRKAYLNAPVQRAIYVRLPKEDHEPGMCGRLNVSLYGTRDAARNWEEEYTRTLEAAGYVHGRASPCIFLCKDTGGRIVVHGDDFTLMADQQEIDRVCRVLKERYEIKLRGVLGPGVNDDKEISLLNRIVRWTDAGIEYESDPRHAEILVEQLGLSGAKPVRSGTPEPSAIRISPVAKR